MEHAFSRALEVITDRMRLLEEECNAFVHGAAAENTSLRKQSMMPLASRMSMASTIRDHAQSGKQSRKAFEDEAHKRSSRAVATFEPSTPRQPAQTNGHPRFEDAPHKGTGEEAAESLLPSTPRDTFMASSLTRELQSLPAWRGSPVNPRQPAADLALESLESEEVSIPKGGGTSLANGHLTMVQVDTTGSLGKSNDDLMVAEPSGRLVADDSANAVAEDSATAAGASKSAMIFQRYDVRPLWWDHEFDSVCLQSILQSSLQHQKTENLLEKRSTPRSYQSLGVLVDAPTGKHSWFILHPDSTIRAIWVLSCVVLLGYDIITVPFVICFEPPESGFSKIMVLTATIFWTADIPLNLITGVRTIDGVEMRFQHIAYLYAKSWLLFDILLVFPEWITMAIGNQFRSHSVLRLARWGRLTRLLRMARLMRLETLRPMMRRIAYKYHLSKLYVVVTQGWLGTSIMLVLSVHITSCFWYLFGKSFDDGWVEANGLSNTDVGTIYVISVRWTLCRLQGLISNYNLTSTADMLMDVFLILGTFILVSFYISTMTAVTMTRVTDRCPSLWEKGTAFVQRHQVSAELSFRLEKALQAAHYAGAIETACDESTLLEALPTSLQQDLIYEARKRIVCGNTFFKNLLSFNRQATRHICNEAITLLITVEEEVLFTYADACHRMLFINSGRSKYFLGCDAADDNAQELEQGSFISEPVLWTTWEHKGHLKSLEESVMLALDTYNFADVVLQHKSPNMVAVRYAKHFVWKMNQATMPHDMVTFPELTLVELDTALFMGSAEDHFMFISHYKVEAGTEATLMRDLLVPMLAEDRSNQANNFQSPIFIDSEDLSDLSRLKAHVVGSGSLVLLLTPGLLSRPWCLIEIVTALENDVNIVPVEIQRPGSSYRYPDEEFYASLREGRLLGQNAVELLATEGIQLQQVEAAIRKVFLKIACPFSPHKTKAIREAELDFILTRCNGTRGDPIVANSGSGRVTKLNSGLGRVTKLVRRGSDDSTVSNSGSGRTKVTRGGSHGRSNVRE